jgi:GNAT superfamily N-acetyltransferase
MIEQLVFVGREREDLLLLGEQLRQTVWLMNGAEPSGALRQALAIDALDAVAVHVAFLHVGRLVALAQVSTHSSLQSIRDGEHFAPYIREHDFPVALFNRLLVHPAYREQGLARRADEARLLIAARSATHAVFVEARGQRISALESLGFEVCGPSADNRYPGHWSILRRDTA